MRGFQHCTFCGDGSAFQIPTVVVAGREYSMGYAEIRVPGRADVRYAAPTLIYHYITAHEYLPPQEFIDALRELAA